MSVHDINTLTQLADTVIHTNISGQHVVDCTV